MIWFRFLITLYNINARVFIHSSHSFAPAINIFALINIKCTFGVFACVKLYVKLNTERDTHERQSHTWCVYCKLFSELFFAWCFFFVARGRSIHWRCINEVQSKSIGNSAWANVCLFVWMHDGKVVALIIVIRNCLLFKLSLLCLNHIRIGACHANDGV